MSDNYRFYAMKMSERRTRFTPPALRRDLEDLFNVVRRCEAMWKLENRIERSR